MNPPADRDLGMDRAIPRRDFLDGMAMAAGAAFFGRFPLNLPGPHPYAPERAPGYYPPALTGLRGSHPGSYEVAHRIRDGGLDAMMRSARPSGEKYDLVVVGGGISGLSAAYFYQKAHGGRARVLVLDNHDDFGGHAKRNEFRYGGKLLIGYGGTQSIETPSRYSAEARGLFTELGVDTAKFYTAYDREFYSRLNLKGGIFFDRETFGTDRLIAGLGRRELPEIASVDQLKDAPLSDGGAGLDRPAVQRHHRLPSRARIGPEEGEAREDQLPRLPPGAPQDPPRRRPAVSGLDPRPLWRRHRRRARARLLGAGISRIQGTQARRRELSRPRPHRRDPTRRSRTSSTSPTATPRSRDCWCGSWCRPGRRGTRWRTS